MEEDFKCENHCSEEEGKHNSLKSRDKAKGNIKFITRCWGWGMYPNCSVRREGIYVTMRRMGKEMPIREKDYKT